MVEKLDEAGFFFTLNRAVREFGLNPNKLRKSLSRNVDELYEDLVGNTSRNAMEIAIKLGLMPESMRHTGPDNTVTSTIELAAIMESWGPLTALQTMVLHGYLHAAYEHYLFMQDCAVLRAERAKR